MDRVTGTVTGEAGTVEKYIESHPTQIREIIKKLRLVAKANMPSAHEFMYHNAINYKLPESPGTWICYIAAQRNYVNMVIRQAWTDANLNAKVRGRQTESDHS